MILLSPTKTMKKDAIQGETIPFFINEAHNLAIMIKALDETSLAIKMKIKGQTLEATFDYYQSWGQHKYSGAAIDMYDGIGFKKLDYSHLDDDSQSFIHKNVLILSTLYGILRAMDQIESYRLDFNIHHDAYQLWRPLVTKYLNQEETPYLLSLASQEYEKIIDLKELNKPLITIVFLVNEQKASSSIVKQARGKMAHLIAQNKYTELTDIQTLEPLDFKYEPSLSSITKWIFKKEK